ncbi:hypothetical protein TWF718_001827 [Orbilia javanica]|uniref:Uncharacterized protein n=1 Tax=Orbilia javanica TaxID=47235 RepID=A0AAN8MZH5_9PEZI
MSRPYLSVQRKKDQGLPGLAGQYEVTSTCNLKSPNLTLVETSQSSAEILLRASSGNKTDPSNVPGNPGTPEPEQRQQKSPVSQVVENTQAIRIKCQEPSPVPRPDIVGESFLMEGLQWSDYREKSSSATSYSSEARPEDMSQAQLDYFFALSQQSSSPPTPPPAHFHLHQTQTPSKIEFSVIQSSLESNSEEEASKMVNLRRSLVPQSSLSSLGREVGSSQTSGGRVATTIAATQRRKRHGSQLQRESPQVPKDLEKEVPKKVLNPLDCEKAKERILGGQFAVHSELSAGEILQSQVRTVKGLFEDLDEILDKGFRNKQDPHVKDIQHDIKEFLSSGIEGEGIVGFLGKVGTGKSTLLNALLDLEDFIPTRDEGRCMPIILEFAKSKPGLGPFAMDVKYFTKAQLKEDAEALFREIYVEGGKLQKPNTREAKSINRRFNHLFPGEKWDTVSDVNDHIDELFADDEALQRGEDIIHAMDEEACAEQLRDLTVSNSKDRPTDPEIWPLIDKIRIYLDSEVLNTGTIIADIPGIDDDGTRVKAMQKYLSGVQDIIIVTPLKSIFEDANTLAKLGYEGVTFLDGRSRGVLVTNHLDEYGIKQAQLWFKKNRPFKENLEKAVKELSSAGSQFGYTNRADLRGEKAEAAAVAEQKQKEVDKLCSSVLDDFILPHATITFGSTIPTDDISWQVFRVDPIAYKKSRKDSTFLTQVRENMSVQQMVELQDYIGALTYPRQFRLAIFKIREAQRIIANLIFWSSSEVRLPEAIQIVLEKHIRSCLASLESEMGIVRVEISRHVSKSLVAIYAHAEAALYEAIEKAQHIIMHINDNINNMRHTCRAGGEFSGHDWNSKFLEEVRESMCGIWKQSVTFAVQMMNTYQERYHESILAIELHSQKILDEQKIEDTLKAAFKNLISKEFLGIRSQLIKMCRDNVREVHNMFRYGARTFLRPDALKELM